MKRTLHSALAGVVATAAAACFSVGCGPDPTLDAPTAQGESTLLGSSIQHVFVIMMENQNSTDIYGSSKAPYINQLMKQYAYASDFGDVLSESVPSEPHYVWLEAGTNVFSDHTFTSDSDASSSNSTASTAHLVNQLERAGLTWMAYQEGVNSSTGSCPISSSLTSAYAAKHNPFVFFRDVSGGPPSKSSSRCISHTRSLDQLQSDLHAGTVPSYSLITPNLCHDMHGAIGCPIGSSVTAGDNWLKSFLPSLITYANANQGVIFITWDEPEGKPTQPFIVVGPHLKSSGYASSVHYNMSSVLKSLQRIFAVTPLLGHAADASTNDLADFFAAGYYP